MITSAYHVGIRHSMSVLNQSANAVITAITHGRMTSVAGVGSILERRPAMVDRYGSLCGNDDYQEMAEADDGAWIKYSDYEALEAKCNDWHKVADERSAEIIRLEAKLAALVETAIFSKCAIDNYIHKEWGIQELEESYDRLKVALAAKEG